MPDQFQIILPATVSKQELESIQNELKSLNGIENAGAAAVRGLDPETIAIAFKVAGAVLAAVGAGVPLFQKIMNMIRKRKIASAHIKFPDGTEIALENATMNEIEEMLNIASKKLKQADDE
jgi:hypothetical protein